MDEHRTARRVITVAPQRIKNGLLLGQANPGEMRRMLGLRIHADSCGTGAAAVDLGRQLQDVIEGRNQELSVEGAVLRPQFRQPLPRPQRLDLGQCEVFGEPARHGFAVDGLSAAARRKFCMLRDVGGAADLVLVPGDEDPVAGHDQVGLDVIGTLLYRQPVRFNGVLGTFAAGAPMCDHDNAGQGNTDLRMAL